MNPIKHAQQSAAKSKIKSGWRSMNSRKLHTLDLLFRLTIWTSSYVVKEYDIAIAKPWLSLGEPPNDWEQGVWSTPWLQTTKSQSSGVVKPAVFTNYWRPATAKVQLPDFNSTDFSGILWCFEAFKGSMHLSYSLQIYWRNVKEVKRGY